ncbi:hypothetical protein M514_07896 [Trichuris suis]|uniref:Uncharacterized protein n=1 Tax=Trichuris suis TaxID=68888 RepID=A0A085M250_9BILA|nr:hypothetical protein M513_07896 [Trichuris suis]KFD63912.1 hypothetical protein M514_07896 [Trichuris suis]
MHDDMGVLQRQDGPVPADMLQRRGRGKPTKGKPKRTGKRRRKRITGKLWLPRSKAQRSSNIPLNVRSTSDRRSYAARACFSLRKIKEALYVRHEPFNGDKGVEVGFFWEQEFGFMCEGVCNGLFL